MEKLNWFIRYRSKIQSLAVYGEPENESDEAEMALFTHGRRDDGLGQK